MRLRIRVLRQGCQLLAADLERFAGSKVHEQSLCFERIGLFNNHRACHIFAAGYDLSKYKQPIIFTGCDGVGTKLELLLKYDLLENAGKDLVAMNVNDVLTCGADPILFLDYVGINKIIKRQLTRIIAGMSEYLTACNCILAGGETAEMPGAVLEGMVELSGFAIGAAEKKDVLNPAEIKKGDVLIGWPSAGFHANGFSLVRRIIAKENLKFSKSEEAVFFS